MHYRTFFYAILTCLTTTIISPATASPIHGKVAQISYVEMKSSADLETLFRNLHREGYGTVILRIFHNRHDRYLTTTADTGNLPDAGVYFPTEYAPVIQDLTTPAVEQARRYDMQLFAWLGTRRADWLPPQNKLKDPVTDRLSLYAPGSIPYLQQLFSDLARTGVNGILIQDDLVYRTHDELPAGVNVQNYRGYTPEYRQIANKRALIINQTLEAILDSVHQVNPHCKVWFNIYYENGTNPDHALMWLAQDLELLAKLPIDRFSIMSYHRQIAQELNLSPMEAVFQTARIIKNIAATVGYQRIIPKIQTEDFVTGESVPLTEVQALERLLPPSVPVAYMPVRRTP
ncbi:poly-beta-1,6-N-acetyl-D-glucosamine N-deacetylase PgaB [Desulfurispira natronophila]|uniref:Biofilm PGA synthesis lipoprotein PgaB n=1 Tax=Desulfurispira natronophila TaxID=682562 RepID=A0A7W7Y264_9BACT|nr:poly-beta-1,6-N-acetyl-D-glucosamine N-deacetylase PgaB [Desulfurispira natronophila]MBB5020711.1 biofilm PGA synthesis lipoprotein PgaB [Desulfurispira natronophila]